ncbi:8657_t:CDS:2, partial [Funneliformis mosseae]
VLTEEVCSLKESQLKNESSTLHKSSALAPKDQIQRDASLMLKLETEKKNDVRKDEFKENCETLMNESRFHSNKISETDEKLTKKEIKGHIQLKNKNEADKHILHVYDKP